MQTLAAYVIFLLVVVGITLALILCAILGFAASAGIAWMKSRPGFRIWQRSVSKKLARTAARIESELATSVRCPALSHSSLGAVVGMVMAYATGQKPRVGDVVFDSDRRIGTVTHIMRRFTAPGELVIEWDDGTIDIRYSRHEALMLLERYAVASHMPRLVLFADSSSRSPR